MFTFFPAWLRLVAGFTGVLEFYNSYYLLGAMAVLGTILEVFGPISVTFDIFLMVVAWVLGGC